MEIQSIPTQIDHPFLKDWLKIKDRGALIPIGEVYTSPDKTLYLRTGEVTSIQQEAAFAQDMSQRNFPVPKVIESGKLSQCIGYFIETAVGDKNYGDLFQESYSKKGVIEESLFTGFCEVSAAFLKAQISQTNRQIDNNQLRKGIQLDNILEENPDIPFELLEQALLKAEHRTVSLPLVFTHGDFNPFNVMPNGVIDFEDVFIAPAGYDVLPGIIYNHFFNFPSKAGKPTLIYEFSKEQFSQYFQVIDMVSANHSLPPLSPFFDDFVMLKSIWALCYEKMHDGKNEHYNRWHWRRNIMLHCIESYLADKPIQVDDFFSVGLSR